MVFMKEAFGLGAVGRVKGLERLAAVGAGAGVFLFKRWPCAAQPGEGALAAQRYDGGGA